MVTEGFLLITAVVRFKRPQVNHRRAQLGRVG